MKRQIPRYKTRGVSILVTVLGGTLIVVGVVQILFLTGGVFRWVLGITWVLWGGWNVLFGIANLRWLREPENLGNDVRNET